MAFETGDETIHVTVEVGIGPHRDAIAIRAGKSFSQGTDAPRTSNGITGIFLCSAAIAGVAAAAVLSFGSVG